VEIGAISFGRGQKQYEMASKRLNKQLSESQMFQAVKIYNTQDLDLIIDQELRDFILTTPKGYGLWIWKPIIILDFLEKNPQINLVMYLDVGCEFLNTKSSHSRFKEYLLELESSKFLGFQLPNLEKFWTSQNVIELLGADSAVCESGQVAAGHFFMQRNFAIKFCNDWLANMRLNSFKYLKGETEELETNPTLIQHRQDQSLLSVMVKREKEIKLIPSAEAEALPPFGDFPILAARNLTMISISRQDFVAKIVRRFQNLMAAHRAIRR